MNPKDEAIYKAIKELQLAVGLSVPIPVTAIPYRGQALKDSMNALEDFQELVEKERRAEWIVG